MYPADPGPIYLGNGGRGIQDSVLRFDPSVSGKPVECAAPLDSLATGGPELVATAYLLASDLFQSFGQPEATQLTRDGQLRLPFWNDLWKPSVQAWAADAGISISG